MNASEAFSICYNINDLSSFLSFNFVPLSVFLISFCTITIMTKTTFRGSYLSFWVNILIIVNRVKWLFSSYGIFWYLFKDFSYCLRVDGLTSGFVVLLMDCKEYLKPFKFLITLHYIIFNLYFYCLQTQIE